MDELQWRKVLSSGGQQQLIYLQKRSLLTAPLCILRPMIHRPRYQATGHRSCNINPSWRACLNSNKEMRDSKEVIRLSNYSLKGKNKQCAEFSGGQIVYKSLLWNYFQWIITAACKLKCTSMHSKSLKGNTQRGLFAPSILPSIVLGPNDVFEMTVYFDPSWPLLPEFDHIFYHACHSKVLEHTLSFTGQICTGVVGHATMCFDFLGSHFLVDPCEQSTLVVQVVAGSGGVSLTKACTCCCHVSLFSQVQQQTSDCRLLMSQILEPCSYFFLAVTGQTSVSCRGVHSGALSSAQLRKACCCEEIIAGLEDNLI